MNKLGARSRILMISLPMALALLLLLSGAALLVAGYIGRPAVGERLTLSVVSGCAGAWQDTLGERAAAIGLGDPSFTVDGDTVQLTATLPGNPDDRESVPRVLTAPGALTLHTADGQVVAHQGDLDEARLALNYMARTSVVLRPSDDAWARIRALDPDAVLVATLDGVSVALGEVIRVGRDDELHVQPALERAPDEMKMAADWAIVLGSGVAPCVPRRVSLSEPAAR